MKFIANYPIPGTGGAGGAAIKGSGTYIQSTGTVQFSNSNGVTFGLSNNGVMTASVAAVGGAQTGISGLSAGTTQMTSGTAVFSNSNGISFGVNGNTITASYNSTQFQSTGNYLTTAALSNQVVNSLNGSTGQISLNVGSSLSSTANASGITFGLASNITTALQSAGAYLTTAMASNRGSDFMGTNTALTANGVSMTANSSGLSLNFPAFLTTAQSPGAYLTTARASNDAIGLNTALTANGVQWTVNSSGLSLNVPAFLTTAMQSQSSSVFAKTGFTSASTAGSDFAVTLNTAGLSMGIPKYLTTAQSPGAYLTTAMASNRGSDFVGVTTVSGTNVSGTFASNGISLSANAAGGGGVAFSASASSMSSGTITFSNSNGVFFGLSNGVLTASASTAPAGSLFFGSSNGVTFGTSVAGASTTVTASIGAGAGAAFKGSGTYTQNSGTIEFANSNGITFGLSNNGTMTASHNGITTQTVQPVAISGSNGSFAFSTVSFGNLNGASFYTSNGSVVASYTVPSTAGHLSAINVSGGTTSNNLSAITFSNSNGVSFGLNGSVMTATVATNYQSAGAYLTTAAQSNQVVNSINGSTGTFSFNTGSSLSSSRVGNAITFGLASNITTALQSAGAYLTTAMQSNAATISNINVSGGTTSSNLSGLNFVNSNGVSWSLDTASKIYATVKTDYQTSGAYLTTAMQSGSQSQLWIMGNSSATIGGTNISGTIYSNGMSLSAAAPGGGGNTMTISAANGTFQSNAITFANSNGVSFSTGTQGVYATVATNYLTTAMASNRGSDFLNVSGGFTGTNITGTLASNGLQLNVGPAQDKITLVGIFDGAGSAVSSGATFYIACPYAGTISAYSIIVDTGTCTVKTWKKAAGTAIPTVSDSISTSGVAISSGTVVRSTTVTDFTSTTVTANDILAFNITAVSGATKIIFELEITRS